MLFIALSMFVTNAFAELNEVRGVQTRSVSYVEYDSEEKKDVTKWGYELKNENNYAVWLELELKTNGFTQGNNNQVVGGVRDTKSITLKAGETYIWKCGDRMRFYEYGGYCDYHEKFHVVYKAYKAE